MDDVSIPLVVATIEHYWCMQNVLELFGVKTKKKTSPLVISHQIRIQMRRCSRNLSQLFFHFCAKPVQIILHTPITNN